jgi:CDP-L-myo-inositol myo-inositolphosphotransferase
MRSERPPEPQTNLSDALVALVTLQEGAVNRRVAGLAVGARIAAEAQQAGAQALWIVSDAQPGISERTWDDIARACGELEVIALSAAEAETRLAAMPGRPLLLLSASHLVPASLYPRLLAENYLGAGGKIVAAATSAGAPLPILGGPAAEDCPEIIDLADLRRATRIIVKGTAKESDGIVSRHLNRPISQSLSSALLMSFETIRPWQMTLLTAFLTVLMFPILIFGGERGLVVGGLLFHASSVLDGVDGEIARATYRSSVRGAVMDTAVDTAGTLLFIAGLTIGLSRLHGIYYAEIGGWAVVAGAIGLAAMSALTMRIGEHGNFNILKPYYGARLASGFPAQVREWITRITSRDFFAFGCCLLTLAGRPQIALLGFTIFTSLWVVLIVAAAPGILRQAAAPGGRTKPATA